MGGVGASVDNAPTIDRIDAVVLLTFGASTMSLFHSAEPHLLASGNNTQIFLGESERWNRL